MKTVFLALALVSIGSAIGQVVHVSGSVADSDLYSRYYRTDQMVTFAGKVTGIQSVTGGDGEPLVTLLVRNSAGGGTATVDVGPKWFVDHQEAKLKMGIRVQVTGSKIFVGGRSIILASQILVGRQGGNVLALRRPNGKPYWMGVEVAANPVIPTGGNVLDGTIQSFTDYTLDGVPYAAAVLQTNNGLLTIDLGPQWYYGRQNLSYQIGDYLSVVTGPRPIQVGPYTSIASSYTIYAGPSTYTLRYSNGIPVYNGNGR